jgi:hypothetical protein
MYYIGTAVTAWLSSRLEFGDCRGRLTELVAGAVRKKPFRQLIGFDHDKGGGMIRSWTAAKLARDFREWDARAKA